MCFSYIWFDGTYNLSICAFFGCEWHLMLWYEKQSFGAFYSPDTLVKLPQFIGKIFLPGEFFVSCYEVSIILRQPGCQLDDVIGLYGCDEIFGQR